MFPRLPNPDVPSVVPFLRARPRVITLVAEGAGLAFRLPAVLPFLAAFFTVVNLPLVMLMGMSALTIVDAPASDLPSPLPLAGSRTRSSRTMFSSCLGGESLVDGGAVLNEPLLWFAIPPEGNELA